VWESCKAHCGPTSYGDKTDVDKSLLKKTYNVLRVGMTSSQQLLYQWLLTKNFAKLNTCTRGKGMCPKHNITKPYYRAETKLQPPFFLSKMLKDVTVKITVENLDSCFGQIILLDKLLLRLRCEKGHRVLVFPQMVRMLDILPDHCRMWGFPFQCLDGSMPNDILVRAVDLYKAAESTKYFFSQPGQET
jgi:SNF2 family DNA or RNA helicase